MSLTFIHQRLATSMLLYLLIAGLWGLVRYLRGKGVDSNYWGILAIGELLFLAQAVIGLTLLLSGGQPQRGIHALYGIVSAISLPAYFAFTRGRDDRSAALVYALLCFFLIAINFRAIATAG